MPPIRLHPDNPHYLLFQDRPTVLIGSGEHYGAVLNLDFDYLTYLRAVGDAGLNLTRTFSGTYREVPGSFKIVHNSLAPRPERYLCPWARTDTPGEALGGNKFDLRRYDEAYFERLKDFVAQAGRRGIVVELVLFCVLYNDELWRVNPMCVGNNVNGLGNFGRERAYAPEDNDLLPVQLDLVRTIAGELRGFDNLYYEVMNEPYITDRQGCHLAWQRRVIDALVEAESSPGPRHLIAQNVANKTARIADPHPAVSILNFHYAEPSAVADNYHLDRPIADDETGFKGQSVAPYRKEAWGVVLSGGAIVSHLDYSFTAEMPDGTEPITGETPGYGGVILRKELKTLKSFIEGFNFVRMAPDGGVVSGGAPEGGSVQALSEPGRAYALFVNGGHHAVTVALQLPAGAYRAEWVNTHTGQVDKAEAFDHRGGARTVTSPDYIEDIALAVRRV